MRSTRWAVRSVVPSILTAGLLGTAGCSPGLLDDIWQSPTIERPADEDRPRVRQVRPTERSLLPGMGFSLRPATDSSIDAELVASSTLGATFDAPVQSQNNGFDVFGTAHVTFDDDARDLSSAVVTGAYAESGVIYAVLFDESLPWRYVVIAVEEAALVAGESLALDGETAAAVVIDEVTGDGFLALTGTLSTETLDLNDGGRWTGSLNAELAEVTLDAWPAALFPLTDDGEEIETATALGEGTFNAPYVLDPAEMPSGGSSTFSVVVDGFTPFAANHASSFPAEDGLSTAILLTSSDSGRLVIVVADNDLLVDGALVSLGTQHAMAWLLEENGDQVAFGGGTLLVSTANLLGGGGIQGELTLDGSAYIFRCDGGRDCGGVVDEEDPWTEEDCSALDGLAESFAPTGGAIVSAAEVGESLPPGFDRFVYLEDAAADAATSILLPVGTSSEGPFTLDLTPVDMQGRPMAIGALYAYSCGEPLEFEAGTLRVTALTATSLEGTLTVVIAGVTTTTAFSVPLL